MAGNKRTTIQKLTVLQTRLMLVGIVLAVACGVCTVLLRHEKEPEPELILPVETVPFMPGVWTGQPETKKTQPEPSKAEEQALPDETTAPVSQVHPSVPVFPPMTAPVEEPQQELKAEEKQFHIWFFAAILLDVLFGIDLVMLVLTHKSLKKEQAKQALIKPAWHPEQPKIGKVHGIGARSYQQDSLGHTSVLGGSGILAMVADGMGGLAGGDQVSQQVIMSGLNYGAAMTSCQETNPLVDMVRSINGDINRMLGPDLIYKCGSTFIAVLNIKNRFHWISIGDSRIYLYRAGFVNQLNTDHDLMQLWMPEILAGSRSYATAAQNPEGRKLTSFIGMGELKYVDYSRQALRLRPGDRLVLLTDGIYGAVSPETLAAILKENTDVSDAAQALERAVQAAGLPYQDNYTALILGY